MTPSGWIVRPKTEHDAARVAERLAEVAREGRWIATEWPFDVAQRARAMHDALRSGIIVGWVACDADDIVADLTVFDLNLPEPSLGMLVAASHRRRGIGRALLDAAFAWARENERTALTLRVFPDNDAARSLYIAAGFVDVTVQPASVPRREGGALDAIVMRRPVTVS
jgi:ribosomal protein S18 acetylase RimI-like enzyme